MSTTEQDTEVKETPRGDRGELGVATAALTIRQLWHAAFFQRENDGKRTVWVPKVGVPSLKSFARSLARKGNQVAQDWLAHKKGSLNQPRTDGNIKIAKEAAFATKTERRKKSANNAAKKK